MGAAAAATGPEDEDDDDAEIFTAEDELEDDTTELVEMVSAGSAMADTRAGAAIRQTAKRPKQAAFHRCRLLVAILLVFCNKKEKSRLAKRRTNGRVVGGHGHGSRRFRAVSHPPLRPQSKHFVSTNTRPSTSFQTPKLFDYISSVETFLGENWQLVGSEMTKLLMIQLCVSKHVSRKFVVFVPRHLLREIRQTKKVRGETHGSIVCLWTGPCYRFHLLAHGG